MDRGIDTHMNIASYFFVASDSALNLPGAAVEVYYPASTGVSHVIRGIVWSYSATPTISTLTSPGPGSGGGNLLITSNGSVVFDADISTSGIGQIEFPVPVAGLPGHDLAVILESGGSNVTGKLNIYHFTQ